MLYDAILIDADDTLFDFRGAEKNAIGAIIQQLGILDEAAPQVYHRLNRACWEAFERGEVTQAELRVRRFRDFLKHYGLDADPQEVGEAYTEALSHQSLLLPGALEAVRAVAAQLPVAVVTNGIPKVQHGRMDPSPLRKHLSAFIISGELGVQKPDPRMLYAALEALGGVDPSRALMVGDSLTSDIQGGVNAGLDTCWFNPGHAENPGKVSPTYEIASLEELYPLVMEPEELANLGLKHRRHQL